jgi:hypothetical protein
MEDQGKYSVLENWVEIGKFSDKNDALLLQRFTRLLNRWSRVDVFREQGNTMTLIEEEWRLEMTPGNEEMLNKRQGGETNMTQKYLRIRVEGKEGYLKAFHNDMKDKDSDPDYKGTGVAVWVNEAKDAEQIEKPRAQAARL